MKSHKITMKKIRQNVFETNSSSSHSISISFNDSKDLLDNSLIPNEDGNIVLRGQDFGWEIEDYNDAETKAVYMALYATRYAGNESEEFTTTLIEVIKKQTKCQEVILPSEDEGHIDHQSVDSEDYHHVFYNPDNLRQFIFNRESYLHTDNDNH